MSFLDLVESDEALDAIARDVAHRALCEPSAPITNSGITPDQLLDRLRSSTIGEKLKSQNVSDDLSRTLVQAIDDLGL